MMKMTYAQAVDFAINHIDNEEVVEKLKALKGQLEKRGSGKRGMTSTQKANVEVKETILAVLADMDEAVTVTQLLADERLAGFTNQKISALLRQLVEDGKVDKTIEKKKSFFALV